MDLCKRDTAAWSTMRRRAARRGLFASSENLTLPDVSVRIQRIRHFLFEGISSPVTFQSSLPSLSFASWQAGLLGGGADSSVLIASLAAFGRMPLLYSFL